VLGPALGGREAEWLWLRLRLWRAGEAAGAAVAGARALLLLRSSRRASSWRRSCAHAHLVRVRVCACVCVSAYVCVRVCVIFRAWQWGPPHTCMHTHMHAHAHSTRTHLVAPQQAGRDQLVLQLLPLLLRLAGRAVRMAELLLQHRQRLQRHLRSSDSQQRHRHGSPALSVCVCAMSRACV